jgi:hypothetical protein
MPQPQKKGKDQKIVRLLFIILFVSVVQINAQSTPDAELIKQTALDYIEGWYEGDAERMERALHPELATRIVQTDQRGRSNLGQMGTMRLVQLTRIHDPSDIIPKDTTTTE